MSKGSSIIAKSIQVVLITVLSVFGVLWLVHKNAECNSEISILGRSYVKDCSVYQADQIDECIMPNVVDLELEEGQKIIRELGLEVVVREKIRDDISDNIITQQNPKPNIIIRPCDGLTRLSVGRSKISKEKNFENQNNLDRQLYTGDSKVRTDTPTSVLNEKSSEKPDSLSDKDKDLLRSYQ